MAILSVKNIKKTYTTRFGGNQVQALKNVTFDVEQGEYVAIMGESGSGKTTLLNILAALDKPTSGTVLWKIVIFPESRNQSVQYSGVTILDLCFRNLICWTRFPYRITFFCRLCWPGWIIRP